VTECLELLDHQVPWDLPDLRESEELQEKEDLKVDEACREHLEPLVPSERQERLETLDCQERLENLEGRVANTLKRTFEKSALPS
jgi:hypothetical protein